MSDASSPIQRFGRRSILSAVATAACVGASRDAHADISRMQRIRKRVTPRVKALFSAKNVAYPPKQLFLRVFKHDDELELWAASAKDEALSLIKTYPVCAKSGVLGPKRRWGDEQVPEGFYTIHRYNAWSGYHQSMRVDYPNNSDRVRGRRGALGGAIMVHGKCVTIGCIPIEDRQIEEVFLASLDSTRASRTSVPIHIFPTRLTKQGLEWLAGQPEGTTTNLSLWRELQAGYLAFELDHRVPQLSIDRKTGVYTLVERPSKA